MSPTISFTIPSARRSSLGRASAGRNVRSIDLQLRTLPLARFDDFVRFFERQPIGRNGLTQGGARLIVGETLAHSRTLARPADPRHHVSGGGSTC